MNRHDTPRHKASAQSCSSTGNSADPLQRSSKARHTGRHNQQEAHMGDGGY